MNRGVKLLLGILKETAPGESRVALLPESLKSLLAQGIAVTIEAGAGMAAGASDAAYVEAGATIAATRSTLLAEADVLPVVNAPCPAEQANLKHGAVLIGFLRPLDAPRALSAAIDRPATLFSMELVPRISRAQSMDALSSMATVAGYKAIIAAAVESFFSELGGITASTFGADATQIYIEELGSERAHLFTGGGAHVVGLDDGA